MAPTKDFILYTNHFLEGDLLKRFDSPESHQTPPGASFARFSTQGFSSGGPIHGSPCRAGKPRTSGRGGSIAGKLELGRTL